MPLYLQAKLLRVLEDRSVTKIGSTKSREVDIQVISATNKKLMDLIKSGMFREDLFYRLNVIPIEIPALRSRKEDIRLITMQFVEKYVKLFEKKLYKIENTVWEYFENYNWPGNVRELQNVIEYLVSMIGDEGVIRGKSLPFKIISYEEEVETEEGMNLESLEKRTIKKSAFICEASSKEQPICGRSIGNRNRHIVQKNKSVSDRHIRLSQGYKTITMIKDYHCDSLSLYSVNLRLVEE